MSGRFEVTPLLAMAECVETAGYDSFVEAYYAVPYEAIARIQGFHAGDPASCLDRLQRFVAAGVRHIVLRFGGRDQAEQLGRATREILPRLGA